MAHGTKRATTKPRITRRYGAMGIVFEKTLTGWVGTKPGRRGVIVAWEAQGGGWCAYWQTFDPASTPDHPIIHRAQGRGFSTFGEVLVNADQLPPLFPHTCSGNCIGVPVAEAA